MRAAGVLGVRGVEGNPLADECHIFIAVREPIAVSKFFCEVS